MEEITEIDNKLIIFIMESFKNFVSGMIDLGNHIFNEPDLDQEDILGACFVMMKIMTLVSKDTLNLDGPTLIDNKIFLKVYNEFMSVAKASTEKYEEKNFH